LRLSFGNMNDPVKKEESLGNRETDVIVMSLTIFFTGKVLNERISHCKNNVNEFHVNV